MSLKTTDRITRLRDIRAERAQLVPEATLHISGCSIAIFHFWSK